jgi:hypothetical protein
MCLVDDHDIREFGNALGCRAANPNVRFTPRKAVQGYLSVLATKVGY